MTEDPSELRQRPANYVPLSPVSFIKRSAAIWPDRTAVIDGSRRYTYSEFYARCRRLAHALQTRGIGHGDTVSILAANSPALLEAHYAAPMIGAVLNPINTRLDAGTISFCLKHGKAKLFLADRDFEDTIAPALEQAPPDLVVVEISDPEAIAAPKLGSETYEDILASADPGFAYPGPRDEWDSICLLYTSGTTGDPKGAVYSHRGAYLAAMGNAVTLKLDHESVYLWTLPMFHCSGWTFTWAVTALGGTHVCLRRVEPERIFALIEAHKVTHMCGAPIILNLLVHAPEAVKIKPAHRILCATGGAAPPSAVIAAMDAMGFEVLHLYGATESYGPALYCAPMAAWDTLPERERHTLMAHQGISYPMLEDMIVGDPVTNEPVAKDGLTMGEVMFRGNSVMKGYLGNPKTTDATFAGEWYHSGDLAVWHPNGYVEVKDRSKDVIISGGENISSLEVEDVLYRHPAIMDAAVVAKPDETWGETPCAFVELVPDGNDTSVDEIIAFCRENLAGFKVPKHIVFGPLPKTSTGKIQKFRLREMAKS